MSDAYTIRVDDRLCLRPLTAEDRIRCVELLNDQEISQWMLRVAFPYGNDDFDQFLGIAQQAKSDHGMPLHYSIRHSELGMIGGLGFEGIVPGHQLEVGYWLGREFWGRGIMSAVVPAACEFAESQWDVVRITAAVFDGNEASCRVLQKCGFQYEGLLRKRYVRHERFIDARLYALIREED